MNAAVLAIPAEESLAAQFRQYICRACGLIYDEEFGDPDSGLPPGTRFEDIPDDWSCPLCGVTKTDFDPYVAQPRGCDAGHSNVIPFRRAGGAGIVIVGAGTAGWQMARAIRELDRAVPVTLVTNCTGDVYDKPLLSVAMAKTMTGDAMVKESGFEAAAKLGIRLLVETHAISVAPEQSTLRTTRGPIKYGHLVLAHGAAPRVADALPRRVCWAINDLLTYTKFREALSAGGERQRIAIVGAGLVGSELANDLALGGHQVLLTDVSARPLASVLTPAESQELLDAWSALNISFVGQMSVKVASKTASGINLQMTDGTSHMVDHVISAMGLVTPSRLAQTAGLEWNNGISVHPESLRTSVENIHALGDCISISGQPLRYIEPIGRQARVIAATVTGCSPQKYEHTRPIIRVKTTTKRFTA